MVTYILIVFLFILCIGLFFYIVENYNNWYNEKLYRETFLKCDPFYKRLNINS